MKITCSICSKPRAPAGVAVGVGGATVGSTDAEVDAVGDVAVDAPVQAAAAIPATTRATVRRRRASRATIGPQHRGGGGRLADVPVVLVRAAPIDENASASALASFARAVAVAVPCEVGGVWTTFTSVVQTVGEEPRPGPGRIVYVELWLRPRAEQRMDLLVIGVVYRVRDRGGGEVPVAERGPRQGIERARQ